MRSTKFLQMAALLAACTLFLEYDGTLRKTISGNKYPVDPNDQEILPNRAEVLRSYQTEKFFA